MIHGAHVIIYSKDADADRAFIRDVLGFGHVDVGRGWLIFGLPPAEVAVHPASGSGSHEMYLMCDDIERFRAEMAGHGVSTSAAQDEGWGVITHVSLPSGASLGVYEPRHARPPVTGAPALGKAKASGAKASGAKASGAKASAARTSAAKASVGKARAAKGRAAKPSTKQVPARPASRSAAKARTGGR